MTGLTFGGDLHVSVFAISAAKSACSLGDFAIFLVDVDVNLDPQMRASLHDHSSRLVDPPFTAANMTHPLTCNLPSPPPRYYLEGDIFVMSRRVISIIASLATVA